MTFQKTEIEENINKFKCTNETDIRNFSEDVDVCHILHFQWWIQDFPEVGAPTPKVGVKIYYLANFPPKMHEN